MLLLAVTPLGTLKFLISLEIVRTYLPVTEVLNCNCRTYRFEQLLLPIARRIGYRKYIIFLGDD